MPTLKLLTQSAPPPAPLPSDRPKDGGATDGGGGGGDGDGIVPVPSTNANANAETNGRVVDDSSNVVVALNRPLPPLQKAKLYSSIGGGGGGGSGGGLDFFGGGGGSTTSTNADGSNNEENVSPVVPPSAKKSRPNPTTTMKVMVTTGGSTDIFGGIALPPICTVASSSPPALIAAASSATPGSKKRVTISDGIGYINGVGIGCIGSGGDGGHGHGGPGSRCFDILDLNGQQRKSPSLGRFAKTPGPLKSAEFLLANLSTNSSVSTEESPSIDRSMSFRKTPGAGRKKQSARSSSFSNFSKKRPSSTALLANAGGGIDGDNDIGLGGGTVDDIVEFTLTPADRAKARSRSKVAASSATKARLLQKVETIDALDASKAKDDGEGDPQPPVILSALSSNGSHIDAKVVVALDGQLVEVIIEGLGDRPGTYRARSSSGLSLQLDRVPIDAGIYGTENPLAYQLPSETSTAANNGTLVVDDDDDDAAANHSWLHGGTSSPHRTYPLTSSNEKLVLSEPRRVSNLYDNSFFEWSAEDVATPSRDITLASAMSSTDGDAGDGGETGTVLSDDATTVAYDTPGADEGGGRGGGDTSTVFSGDTTVAYDMPRADDRGGNEDLTEEDVLDGDGEKGKEEEYFGDAEGLEEDSLDDGKATGLTQDSLGTVDPSQFMPNDDDAGLVDEDKTFDVEEDEDDAAALGTSEGSNGGGNVLGANDEDDVATLLLSAAGGGKIATGGISRKSSVVSLRRDNSTIHMHSFLAGMATVFLAQAGMGFLGVSFFLFSAWIKNVTGS
mmetsp:Transcript_29659/g.86406  ORF Transcript_29659/g.86406 Transcript_29659/m.86406 type:complete len:787 (+) Transcript_29659:575-2935(+)